VLDGGIRSGSDLVKAPALGAKAVLLGRAPLYGLAACVPGGAREVLQILQNEMEVTMRLLGHTRAETLDRTQLRATPSASVQQG